MPDYEPAAHPYLPQELLDQILQEIAVNARSAPSRPVKVGLREFMVPDYSVLKSCSLVSHSFNDASQRNIFSHIQLFPHPAASPNIATFQTFSEMLSARPHIRNLVRSIRFILGGGLVTLPWAQSRVDLATVDPTLSPLINLAEITLEFEDPVEWNYIPQSCFRRIFSLPAITSIQLHGLDDVPGIAELASLLDGCVALKTLELIMISFNSSHDSQITIPLTSPNLPLMQLESLDLNIDPSIAPLLRWVSTAMDITHLTSLSTSAWTQEDEIEMQHILNTAVSETLEFLHIMLAHEHPNIGEEGLIDIRRLSRLHTLELHLALNLLGAPGHYDPVRWVCNIISSAQMGNQVEHIRLVILVQDGGLHFVRSLGAVEPLLLRPNMSSLKQLTVVFLRYEYHIPLQADGAESELRAGFQTLERKLRLKVEIGQDG
ncbi:hypothetical protein C8J57DRAFT_1334705 [Mycena rebaudengoi]|nr:hypothetical protein C8J57DRAFT_1334705 [Mycena rebaudengoi]